MPARDLEVGQVLRQYGCSAVQYGLDSGSMQVQVPVLPWAVVSGWAVICLMRACLARLAGLAGPPADLVLSLGPIAPATWRQCCWPLRGPIAHGHDIHSLGRGLSSPIKRAGDWASALACRACMLFHR